MEVCINDQWGTVCNELWDGPDAAVICRQLGYGFIQNSRKWSDCILSLFFKRFMCALLKLIKY